MHCPGSGIREAGCVPRRQSNPSPNPRLARGEGLSSRGGSLGEPDRVLRLTDDGLSSLAYVRGALRGLH